MPITPYFLIQQHQSKYNFFFSTLAGPQENTSLLESFHNTRNNGSNSDLSVHHLCEIEDSDFDQISPMNNQQEQINNSSSAASNKSGSMLSLGTSSGHTPKKSVNWSNTVQHTDV